MRRLIFTLCLVCSVCCRYAVAQTVTSGAGGLIPTNGTSDIDFSMNVSGLASNMLNSMYGLQSVTLNISHAAIKDLEITLYAPDGTGVLLVADAPNGGTAFAGTVLKQSATVSVLAGSGTYNSASGYKPISHLGTVNNGQNGNGTWKLHIYDRYAATQGSLTNWSLTFGNTAPVAPVFTESNLPIITINTAAQNIRDEPKITATMGVIWNGTGNMNHLTDPPNNYSGNIGIELRGSSSQGFPKKPYGFETQTALGVDSDVSLLGMPAQSDWVLFASYTDKSLLNNALAYKLFRDFGGYAPRTAFVELVINNVYKGVYVLIEKVKRDANRVDVSKMTTADNSGNNLTGGYILKVDKTTGSSGSTGWYSSVTPPPPVSPANKTYFQYEYPKSTEITVQQKAYIKSYVDSFEAALDTVTLYSSNTGWRKYADEMSFARMMLLNEVSRNVDGYRISSYLYKAKITKGGKLYAGPPWDYDIAFGNANYCSGNATTGWAYNFGSVCPGDGFQVPFWWTKLQSDTLFRNNAKCLYNVLRAGPYSTASLNNYIDSMATVLSAAQVRNFNAWQILGTYVWPNPTPIPASYAAEIAELKTYLQNRLTWMDANVAGTCIASALFPLPLPVKLLSIEASRTGVNEADIRWTVASTAGIRQFVVERSVDGSRFAPAGSEFPGAGNATGASFTLTDHAATSDKTWYYRLRTEEESSEISYSQVVVLRGNPEEQPELIIYPNPVTGEKFRTILRGANGIGGTLTIADMSGKVLTQQTVESAAGALPITIDLHGLPAGSYLCYFTGAGVTTKPCRLIRL